MSDFIINGITVEFAGSQNFSQNYTELNGKHRRRKMDGSLLTQSHWSKIGTTLSGVGWMPSGLDDIDYTANMTLSCVAPRSIASTSRVITIPAARRTDGNYVAYGMAIKDNIVSFPGQAIVTNEMTIVEVTGADQYMAVWFPEITVQADYESSFDQESAVWSWSLTCEET